jgi:hypothetical protein
MLIEHAQRRVGVAGACRGEQRRRRRHHILPKPRSVDEPPSGTSMNSTSRSPDRRIATTSSPAPA